MRLHFTEQVADNFYVGFTDRILLDFTGFVEGEVQEVTTFQRNVVVSTSCARFATADQTFDGQDIACIHIAVFFVFQEFTDFGVLFTDHLIFTVYKDLVESVDEMHEANYFFIAYGNVSRSLVSYMDFMFLFYQAADRTTHRDHIVIGMRRKYDYSFRIWFCTFRTICVVCFRFTPRPSGNGVLQVVEYLDIYVISRSEEGKQLAQAIFVVIFIGQFQDWFAGQLAQPHDCATDQFVIPFAGSDQPWTLNACQVGSC